MDDYVFKRRITGEVVEEMSLNNDGVAFEQAIRLATKYNDSIQAFRYIGTAEPEGYGNLTTHEADRLSAEDRAAIAHHVMFPND